MSTPSQKAEDRPISFVLHNMAKGEDPIEVPLVIRPEDLTRTDVSRLNVNQTLGGAWVDNFGRGVPTVQIAGHTGWGAGSRKDGLAEFLNLHKIVFQRWHALRDEAIKDGLDPDLVRLIFADRLDEFTWVVAPVNFVLKRNRSRPLLSQYQINLTWLSDDVAQTMSALEALKKADADKEALKNSAIDSLLSSINRISNSINSKLTSILGPVQKEIDRIAVLTNQVLGDVKKVVMGVLQIPAGVSVQLLNLAASLTRAASNVYATVASIAAIPIATKAYFQQVSSAFENAFCLLKNVLSPRFMLPNYDDLYGSSNCSSTSGGKPLSVYDTINPFNVYEPVSAGSVSVGSASASALFDLEKMDPVLDPMTLDQMSDKVIVATSDVKVSL